MTLQLSPEAEWKGNSEQGELGCRTGAFFLDHMCSLHIPNITLPSLMSQVGRQQSVSPFTVFVHQFCHNLVKSGASPICLVFTASLVLRETLQRQGTRPQKDAVCGRYICCGTS